MPSEIEEKADFSYLRYAQCWEDADLLLKALNLQPGQVCLSIISGGENTLSLLTQEPEKVIAIDFNPAQVACFQLKVTAYQYLDYGDLLIFLGIRGSRSQREQLYAHLAPHLCENHQQFWQYHYHSIQNGILHSGKFERYLNQFRRYILPLVNGSQKFQTLFHLPTASAREEFYQTHINHWGWKLLFRLFFSQFVLGRLGRDPAFFAYVEQDIAQHLLQRSHYACTQLNPLHNPYLQWILFGNYTLALPHALREKNVVKIKQNLHRLECHCLSLEDYLTSLSQPTIDRYNLSNIFEYMSRENYHHLLQQILKTSHHQARLAYWNLLVPRQAPENFQPNFKSLTSIAQPLYQKDKAFFYSNFILEEVHLI